MSEKPTTTAIRPILAKGEPETVFRNPYMSIETSEVVFPSGAEGKYSVVKSGNGQGVVVILVRRVRGLTYVSCVRQWRFPIGKETIEFPRGGVDDGEEYATAALREVLEETGLDVEPGALEQLGIINPDTGLLSTEVAVYSAFLNESFGLDAPWVEEITGARSAWYLQGDFANLIQRGKVTDGMTLAAWALFQNSNLSRMDTF